MYGGTINCCTINGRLSWESNDTRIHEISLVVDYVSAGYGNDVIGIDSGDISTVSGIATADISKVNGIATADISKVNGV